MREIIFRGKRVDNGKWVEGGILQFEDYVAIVRHSDYHEWHDFVEVIPKTVGQYTGLTDKNGKKIFEGDIVKGTFYGYPMPFENYVFEIGWQEDVAGYKANYFENVEVIGTIHDNSELIGGKDDE